MIFAFTVQDPTVFLSFLQVLICSDYKAVYHFSYKYCSFLIFGCHGWEDNITLITSFKKNKRKYYFHKILIRRHLDFRDVKM